MKSVLIAALCLVSCAPLYSNVGISASYEAVCYNGQSDCIVDENARCPQGAIVIGQSFRPEGRAADDSAYIRIVEHYVCKTASVK